VLLPVPFRGNIPQIPIKESGKWLFTLAIACVNSTFTWSLSSLHLLTTFVPKHKTTLLTMLFVFSNFENALSMHWSMLFRVAPDIDAFMKLSSNSPSRTPFDAPNSILTALIVLVSLLSPSLLYPCSPKGVGYILFYLCPSVSPSVRPRHFSQ
jgi:hypothetical protein